MSESDLEAPTRKATIFKKIAVTIPVVLLLLILSPIILVYVLLYILLTEVPLRVKFLSTVRSQKKSIIFVYSDSLIWKTYLESHILPKIAEHAILLNWSDRNQWNQKIWTIRAFHHWGGRRNFNPLAIVFCNFFKVKTIRFYRPFLDYKHGKEQSLQQAESELINLVNHNIRKPH